jgi:hypothetical protein
VYPDFRDLLAAFVAHQVRFLVVGAHALAVHGIPRATGDLDVWVEPTRANADQIWLALAATASSERSTVFASRFSGALR